MTKTKTTDVWGIKYSPETVDDLIAPAHVIRYLQSMVDAQHLNNFTLASFAPGVGKTTAALVVAKQLNYATKMFNGSMDRGIAVVADQIEPLATSRTMSGKPRCIIIDEADNLTRDAQLALREVINKVAGYTKFIFTCNYPDRIIEPLLSRLPVVNYTYDDKADKVQALKKTIKRLAVIYKEETGKDPDVEAIKEVVINNFPDVRKCFHVVQSMANGADGVFVDDVSVVIDDLISAVEAGDYYKISEMVEKHDLAASAPTVISKFVKTVGREHKELLFPSVVNGARHLDMLTRSDDKAITLKSFFFCVMEDNGNV